MRYKLVELLENAETQLIMQSLGEQLNIKELRGGVAGSAVIRENKKRKQELKIILHSNRKASKGNAGEQNGAGGRGTGQA